MKEGDEQGCVEVLRGMLHLGEGMTEKQHSLAEGSPPGTGELK